ncbi:hypothetical protein F383_22128 [Gossypium arboreum]|nr:hypothetical protein F383_22128 [Gossypium arboreum]
MDSKKSDLPGYAVGSLLAKLFPN